MSIEFEKHVAILRKDRHNKKKNSVDAKIKSIEELAKLGTEWIPHILDNTEGIPHHRIAKAVKTAIVPMGENAIPHLIKQLDDESFTKRCRAADLMGDIGSKTALPHLEKALFDDYKDVIDSANSVQTSAARAIAKIAGKDAEDVLLKRLETAGYETTVDILHILGDVATIKSAPTLLKYLDENDEESPDFAQIALKKIGKPAAPLVAKVMLEGTWETSKRAAEIISVIATPEVIPQLIQAIEAKGTKEEVISNAVIGLARVDKEKAMDCFIKILKGELKRPTDNTWMKRAILKGADEKVLSKIIQEHTKSVSGSAFQSELEKMINDIEEGKYA